jgi:hypothetical protein
LLSPTAPTYTFGSPSLPAAIATPSLVVSPSVISAGGDVTVDVQGSATNFLQDVTTIGFGTSDAVVKQITIIDATHLTAIVTAAANVSAANITVTTGLEVISQALGSQIVATDPSQ